MEAKKASAIQRRMIRRFGHPVFLAVRHHRWLAWTAVTPDYCERMTHAARPATAPREAHRYWDAVSVDHADPITKKEG